MLRIEGLTVQRADWGVLVEAPGAVGVSVIGASSSPIEALGVQRGDAGASIESETNVQVDQRVTIDAFGALSQDIIASVELLAAGTTTIFDATLAIELGGASSVVVFSLESGPDRIRLLVTPGRVRLLRRT